MFLSYKYKFLFVHIAKTGGTSVRVSLQRERYRDVYQIPLWICSRLSGWTGHRLGIKFPRHAKIIAAKEMLPDVFFNSLFKFAFVRNPWDLQVSSFHHIQRERPQLLRGIDNFEQFLKWKMNPERPYQYHIDTSMELQTDYLIDLKGRVLTDFLGHYENLQEDFDTICERVVIPKRKLPHRRQAKDRQAYRQYYTDETAELVRRWFERDIEEFKYDFDRGKL